MNSTNPFFTPGDQLNASFNFTLQSTPLDRLKVSYVRQPTPLIFFSLVTRVPDLLTGTQTFIPDIHVYAQDSEIDSVGRSELSSQGDAANVEMHEDMHSS